MLQEMLAVRFKLVEPLGRGTLGTSYRVIERVPEGRRLVLKVLHPNTAAHVDVRHVLRSLEAQRAHRVEGLAVPRLWDFGDNAFVARDEVAGRPLEFVPRPLDEAVALIIEVTRVLCRLHARNLTHGLLGPSNILQDGARLSLTDAGLWPLLQGLSPEQVLGALHFQAPEQLGLVAGRVDARSDLYALGVLACGLITTRLPFEGTRPSELLQQHAAAALPDFEPAALRMVVSRLLCREPSQRYGSADEVLRDLAEARHRPSQADLHPPFQLAGRRLQLDRLAEYARSVRTGSSRVTVIWGRAGSGKSSMLKAVADGATGMLTASGRCQVFADCHPYQPLAAALQGLLASWRQLSSPRRDAVAASVRAAMGDLAAAAATAFPDLEPLLGPPRPASQAPVGSALLALLQAVARTWCPLVLMQDDLQWAHPATLDLLMNLVRDLEPRVAVWLVFTVRTDDARGPEIVRALETHSASLIECSELDEVEVAEFVEQFVEGAQAKPLADLLYRRCGGLPFDMHEVIRALEARGALRRTAFRWVFEVDLALTVALPAGQVALTEERLRALSEDAREIVAVGALAGSTFDPAVVAHALALPLPTVETACRAAMEARLVEPQGKAYGFLHDRIHQTVMEPLSPARRREIHGALARALEASADPFVLAHHALRSDWPARALPYLERAARRAQAVCAWGSVASLCRQALEIGPSVHDPEACQLLGEACFHLGQFSEAIDVLRRRLTMTCDVDTRVAVLEVLAQAYHRTGALHAAVEVLDDALRLLGERPVVGRVGLWADNLRLLAGLYGYRGLWPRPPRDTGRRRILARLYGHAAVFWHFTDLWRSMHAQLHAMRVGGALDDCEEAVAAMAGLTVVSAFLRRADVDRLGSQAIAMAQRLGTARAHAQALYLYSCGLFTAERWSDLIEVALRAVEVNREAGDYWKAASCHYMAVVALLWCGEGRRARALLTRTRALMQRLGSMWETLHMTAAFHALDAQVSLLDGGLDEAARIGEAACSEKLVDRLFGLLGPIACARVALRRRQFEKALGWLEPVRNEIVRGAMMQTLVADAPTLYAEACAHVYMAGTGTWHAYRAARRVAALFARWHPSQQPALLRIDAAVAAHRGRRGEARRALTRALAMCRTRHLRHEEGRCLHLLGQLRYAWGEVETESLLLAERVYDEVGDAVALNQVRAAMGQPPRALAESSTEGLLAPSTLAREVRRARVIELSREVATTLTLDALVPRLLRSCLEVAGAARVTLFLSASLVDEGEPFSTMADGTAWCLVAALGDENVGPYNDAALRRVSESAVSLRAAASSQGFPTLAGGPALDLLVVPLLGGRGGVTGALYCDAPQPSALLPWEEVGLLEALAEQGIMALQNAIHLVRLERERARIHAAELEVTAQQARREAMAAFLAMASHDLKGGLASIALQARRVRKSDSLAADAIDQACRRSLGLIQTYLDVVRSDETGTLDLRCKEIDLRGMVDDEVDFQLTLLHPARQHTLQVTRRLEAVPVRADGERLRQAIANLVGNALKYAPADGRVWVRLTSNERECRFEVIDDGEALPPADLFRRFERGRTDLDGSGLGLWIARVVVEAHGGTIGVERTDDGNCFWFQLPVEDGTS